MSNLNSTRNRVLGAALIGLIAISLFLIYNSPEESAFSETNQTLDNLEFSGYISTGLRVITSPPENISQITHKSWRKLGTTVIGNTTYDSVGREVRLSIYTFKESSSPDMGYIFAMQNMGSSRNESYFIGEVEVLRIISAKDSPPMEMNMFQKGKDIYVLRYTPDNLETANMILNLAIEGVEI
jgi:hypothetical protein